MNQPPALPLLGRCSCGYALRATDEQAREVERYRDMEAIEIPYRMGANYYVRCPQRHKPFKLYRIAGEYSDKFQCDARCENAKGHDCKCSCGGMNHGKAYAVRPTEVHVASAVSVPAQEPTEPSRRPYTNNAERVHLGVEGERLIAEGEVIRKTLKAGGYESMIYVLKAVECSVNGDGKRESASDQLGMVTWFCPLQYDPGFEVGDYIAFKAHVKRHEDNDYGKSTIVTYLEEID